MKVGAASSGRVAGETHSRQKPACVGEAPAFFCGASPAGSSSANSCSPTPQNCTSTLRAAAGSPLASPRTGSSVAKRKAKSSVQLIRRWAARGARIGNRNPIRKWEAILSAGDGARAGTVSRAEVQAEPAARAVFATVQGCLPVSRLFEAPPRLCEAISAIYVQRHDAGPSAD